MFLCQTSTISMENLNQAADSSKTNPPLKLDSVESDLFKSPSGENNTQDLSIEAWSQAEVARSGSISNNLEGNSLNFTPLDWGESHGNQEILVAFSDGQEKTNDNPQEKNDEGDKSDQEKEEERVRNSILEAFKRIKGNEEESKPSPESNESDETKPQRDNSNDTPQEKDDSTEVESEERQKIKQSLRDLFLDNKDDPLKRKEQVTEALEKFDRPTLEQIAQEEIDELVRSVPEKDYGEPDSPSLFDQAKYPVLTALVAYGGYRILKAGGRATLQKVRGTGDRATSPAESESKSGEKSESKTGETRSRSQAETETRNQSLEDTKQEEARPRRRRSPGGERTVVEFNERVESRTNGEGIFQSEKVNGAEAVLGRDKASESLTRTEVDMLKQEIARLKASKDPAEIKKGNNLERVAKILENSNSPRVQERAHKIIRERIKSEASGKGLNGRVGKAVGVGIIVSAALYYYISQLDHSQDDQENERARVSDK